MSVYAHGTKAMKDTAARVAQDAYGGGIPQKAVAERPKPRHGKRGSGRESNPPGSLRPPSRFEDGEAHQEP